MKKPWEILEERLKKYVVSAYTRGTAQHAFVMWYKRVVNEGTYDTRRDELNRLDDEELEQLVARYKLETSE